jgi:hypothetical protein
MYMLQYMCSKEGRTEKLESLENWQVQDFDYWVNEAI